MNKPPDRYLITKMKTQIATALLAGLAAAHSGVWTITFDGNKYCLSPNSVRV